MNIDIHSHMMPESYLGALTRAGNAYGARLERHASDVDIVVMRTGMEYDCPEILYDPEAKIRELSRLGFDMAVLVPPLTLMHYELTGAAMHKHVTDTNNGLAELQRAYPDRFRSLALLPLQDPAAAVNEIDRVVAELGLSGVAVCTNVLGKNLDVPELRAVFERIAASGLFLFIHAWFVAGADRLPRYHLINAIGNPFDATIAAGSLIFSGLLDDYPALKVCLAHGGGATPFIIGRMDRAHAIRPDPSARNTLPPSKYLESFYYDTILHDAQALQYLVDRVGGGHVLIGSDCPYHLTDMGDPQPFAGVDTLRIASETRERIVGGTAAALLDIDLAITSRQ